MARYDGVQLSEDSVRREMEHTRHAPREERVSAERALVRYSRGKPGEEVLAANEDSIRLYIALRTVGGAEDK